MRECITHHYACQCREAEFRKIEEENEKLKEKLADWQQAYHDEVGMHGSTAINFQKVVNDYKKKLTIAMNALREISKTCPIISGDKNEMYSPDLRRQSHLFLRSTVRRMELASEALNQIEAL